MPVSCEAAGVKKVHTAEGKKNRNAFFSEQRDEIFTEQEAAGQEPQV